MRDHRNLSGLGKGGLLTYVSEVRRCVPRGIQDRTENCFRGHWNYHRPGIIANVGAPDPKSKTRSGNI